MRDDTVTRATEMWFVKRGLPHFIYDYSASRDIWTRALPALTLLFLTEVAINAPHRDFPIWRDALVIAGAYAVLVAVWALSNRLRGRPTFARPTQVGFFEVAFFVVVPALVPLIVGGQTGSAATTAAVNVFILAAIYLSTSYGLVPMTRWAFVRLVRQAGSVLNLLVRALPLLLLFITFLFINTEVWQVASGLQWQALVLTILLFIAIGAAFAVIRLPRQIGELATFESWDEAEARLVGTPLESVVDEVTPPVDGTPPLSNRQWGNVSLVVLVLEGIQIALVALLVFAFFLVFGTIAIEEPVIASWIGNAPDELWSFDLWGQEFVITRELFHVAAFLAGFAGLYFTVFLLTDATYREEFLEEILGEVRESFAARAVYLAYLEPGPEAAASATMSPT